MKLKGLTKLALSGVALAAVAATLGTSTYAWYVANSKAEISSISGTSSSTASGSLLINPLAISGSNVAEDNTAWTNKITATALQVKNTPALQPVTRDGQYEAAGTKTGWHLVDGTSVEAANVNNYVGYFLIGVKTTDANKRKINMTWGIQNDTVTPTPQTAYKVTGSNGTPAGVQANDTFYVDFINALKFDWHVEALTAAAPSAYTTNGTAGTGSDAGKINPYTAYRAESFKGLTLATPYNQANGDADNPAPIYKTGFADAKSDGNAHLYYKSLSEDNINDGGSIIGGETETSIDFSGAANTSFTLADATNAYVLVVRYWLDGADQQCFDSCIGQTFTLNIKLESTANA